jgi:ribosome-associated heat shock protein Hsp15
MDSVRLDKWLWAVRVYKTRSDASDACRGSAIRVNGGIAKPSSKVRIGDTVIARTKQLTRTLLVLDITEKRIGAPLVAEFVEDRTPQSEHDAAQEKRDNARLFSHKGHGEKGRPTKKDRRDIEKIIGPDF